MVGKRRRKARKEAAFADNPIASDSAERHPNPKHVEVTPAIRLNAAKRALHLMERMYPGYVTAGAINPYDAQERIAGMRDIVKLLERGQLA